MPDGMKIERRKLRGEWSNGMLCSARELGLATDHDGIASCRSALISGTRVRRARASNDVVFDLDLTRNRPDASAHLGIARDLAARLHLRSPCARFHSRTLTSAGHDGDGDVCSLSISRSVTERGKGGGGERNVQPRSQIARDTEARVRVGPIPGEVEIEHDIGRDPERTEHGGTEIKADRQDGNASASVDRPSSAGEQSMPFDHSPRFFAAVDRPTIGHDGPTGGEGTRSPGAKLKAPQQI